MSRTRRWLLGIGLALTGLVTYCSWDSWEDVDVPLPEGAGVLTFSRKHAHPFLTEYDYAVRLRLADGRDVESDITPNFGGRTVVLVHWQPAADGNGPFVMIEDDERWTWANIRRGCVAVGGLWAASGPTPRPSCAHDDLPVAHEWQYLGHIDDHPTEPGLRFVPGSETPRDLSPVRNISSETVPIPATEWSITLFSRPRPQGEYAGPVLWMRLASNHGEHVWSEFPQELYLSGKTPLSLYPAEGTSGPFLQIGPPDDGERRIDPLLVDLGARRAFRLRDEQGSKWIEELGRRPRPGHAAITVKPAPAAVMQGEPRRLGEIELRQRHGPGFEWLDDR